MKGTDLIDRRDFIKTLAFGAASADFGKLLKAAERNDRPDTVIIIADDLGWQEFAAPFGPAEVAEQKPGTKSKPQQFALRKTFELNRIPANAAVRLRVHRKGRLNRLTIHLNGHIIAVELPRPGVSMFALRPDQIRLLRKGKNTLALEFNRGAVNPLIDLSLLSVED